MGCFCYFRSLLNEKEQEVYDKIYQEVSKGSLKVVFKRDKSIDYFKIYLEHVLVDHPELFYLKSHIESSYNDTIMELEFEKNKNYNNRKEIANYINNIIEKNFSHLKYEKKTINKIRFVEKWFVNNVVYEDIEDSHNVVGVFIHKRAVCQGISLAAKLVFDYIGVDSLYISGEHVVSKRERHGWNIVFINDRCYHLDITHSLECYEEFLCVSDKSIMIDHSFDQKKYPKCIYDDLDIILNNVRTFYISHDKIDNFFKNYKFKKDVNVYLCIKDSNEDYFELIFDKIRSNNIFYEEVYINIKKVRNFYKIVLT